MLIPPYFNATFLCSTCKFPVHNKACELSGWHVAECQILKIMCVQDWYENIGKRRNIMIHMAVLRGVLLKNTKPSIWSQIMSLESDSVYLLSEDLKNSILYFIITVCKVNGIGAEDVVKFLTIFMKHRLNCCMPCNPNKRYVRLTIVCFEIISVLNYVSYSFQIGKRHISRYHSIHISKRSKCKPSRRRLQLSDEDEISYH